MRKDGLLRTLLIIPSTCHLSQCYRKVRPLTVTCCFELSSPGPDLREGDRVSGARWPIRPHVTFHHARSASSHEVFRTCFGLHTTTRTLIHYGTHTHERKKNVHMHLHIQPTKYSVCISTHEVVLKSPDGD